MTISGADAQPQKWGDSESQTAGEAAGRIEGGLGGPELRHPGVVGASRRAVALWAALWPERCAGCLAQALGTPGVAPSPAGARAGTPAPLLSHSARRVPSPSPPAPLQDRERTLSLLGLPLGWFLLLSGP